MEAKGAFAFQFSSPKNETNLSTSEQKKHLYYILEQTGTHALLNTEQTLTDWNKRNICTIH